MTKPILVSLAMIAVLAGGCRKSSNGDDNNDNEASNHAGDTGDENNEDEEDADRENPDDLEGDGNSVGGSDDTDSILCEYDGKIYQPGESFICLDDCNTCTCESDGSVSATEIACDNDDEPVTGCEYNGKIIAVGEVFEGENGCESCQCEGDGDIDCDSSFCDTDGGWCDYNVEAIANGSSFLADDNCNMCTCIDGEVACDQEECANACTYGGVVYQIGETFETDDQCNICTCEQTREVTCTDNVCNTSGCTDGEIYFEPGCGGQDGMPVITAGCYASCQGASCKTGICQQADINPCVCEEGMACCEACGATEWLCLDEPEACVNFDYVPAIVSAGLSWGMCTGECNFSLTIDAAEGNSCMTASLEVCSSPETVCTRNNTGTLTPRGHAKVTGLAAELQGVTLEEVYGCPGCADGGIATLTFSFDNVESSLSYEHHYPPSILVKADLFAQGLISALNTCTASDDITPETDCTPQAN